MQINDATEAVKQIGFNPTIILIIVLALVGGFTVITRWFMKHIEKKDEELTAVRSLQLEMMKQQTAATAEVAHNLRELNDELKVKRRSR